MFVSAHRQASLLLNSTFACACLTGLDHLLCGVSRILLILREGKMLMIYTPEWQGYSIPREFSGVSWLLLEASQAPLMECRASSLDLQAAFSESYFISDEFLFSYWFHV